MPDLASLLRQGSDLSPRIFRDGCVILERDHPALAARKARVILDYLDFQPVEARCANGVLCATAGRG